MRMWNGAFKELAFLCVATILVAGAVTAWPSVNTLGARIDRAINPVVGTFAAFDWQQDENGYWSAQVVGSKVDSGCIYLAGQQVTAIVWVPGSGFATEANLTFIDDESTDSNRPEGVQTFGRWRIEKPHLDRGTQIRPTVLHTCPHRGGIISSALLPPFIVGTDTQLRRRWLW